MTNDARKGGPGIVAHDHRIGAAESSRLTVAHLGFEDQVAIWALRMVLQGDGAARRVRDQFDRALPAAAARIAYDSLDRMLAVVRQHGLRSLKFHCMCHATITPDEMALLGLFVAVRGRNPEEILSAAAALVDRDGIGPLAGAADIFFQALETRHARGLWTGDGGAGPATVH